MQEVDVEREVKVLVVGNGSVGKSTMIRRLCRGEFMQEHKKTIGVDLLEHLVWVEALGESVKLMVWDTAGQEEFDSLTRTYYRGAGAAVLVFSTVDRASFEAIPRWKEKVEAEAGSIAMALVQNKVDLLGQAAVTPEEAEGMARRLRLRFFRVCVKDNMNVAETFSYLAQRHCTLEGGAEALPQPLPGPATATATVTQASAGSTAASSKQQGTAAAIAAAGPPETQVVNLKARTPKKRSSFLQCSLA